MNISVGMVTLEHRMGLTDATIRLKNTDRRSRDSGEKQETSFPRVPSAFAKRRQAPP